MAGHTTVEKLLGGRAHSVAEIERTKQLANDAARAADHRAADHERRANVAREELAHLDQTGTAPTGADVLAIVGRRARNRSGAVSGLEWIREHNVADADARPEFIAAHPDIAGGVIVSDPARLAAAVAYLTEAKPRTRTPVTVTAAPDATDQQHPPAPAPGSWCCRIERRGSQVGRRNSRRMREDRCQRRIRRRTSPRGGQQLPRRCHGVRGRVHRLLHDTRREDLESRSQPLRRGGPTRRRAAATNFSRSATATATPLKNARGNAESARLQQSRADKHVTMARDLVNKTDTANSATLERSAVDAGPPKSRTRRSRRGSRAVGSSNPV